MNMTWADSFAYQAVVAVVVVAVANTVVAYRVSGEEGEREKKSRWKFLFVRLFAEYVQLKPLLQ